MTDFALSALSRKRAELAGEIIARSAGFRCVGWLQASSGPLPSDQTARPNTWWTRARWAGMSVAGTDRVPGRVLGANGGARRAVTRPSPA